MNGICQHYHVFFIYIYIAGKQLQWPFSQWPFSRYIARCPAGFANGDGSDQVESFLEQNCCMGMGVASRFETKFEINMCIYMNRHAWLHFPAAVSCIRFVVLKLTKGWNINIYIYLKDIICQTFTYIYYMASTHNPQLCATPGFEDWAHGQGGAAFADEG